MITKWRVPRTWIAALLGLVLAGQTGSVAAAWQAADEPPAPTPECEKSAEAAEAAEEQPVKFIKLYAQKWKWSPNVIRVPVGTLVKIEAVSQDASRRFDLKGYKLKVPLQEGKLVSFEFVADKAGTFKWKCSRPCGDGCAKLTGKLIVE